MKMTMKMFLLLLVLMLVSSLSFAGTEASATNFSGSQAGSIAGFNYAPVDNSVYEGSDLSRNVPNLVVPGPGGGGANPCIVSVGGGAVGGGFGFGFSRGYNDQECDKRAWIANTVPNLNLGARESQAIVRGIWCQSDTMRGALKQASAETGNASLACPGDRPKTSYRSSTAPVSRGMTYAQAVQECKRITSDSAFEKCVADKRGN